MPPEPLKLRPPSRSRLVDDVYRSLEEAILAGRMRPGDRLVETWISEQLEVSRTTVREALLMLERQGFVVSEPRRGTFVTRLGREDALDLCYTRALLECFALSAGYSRLDDATFSRMAASLDKMRVCRLPDDMPLLTQYDREFHKPLVDAAGSRRITELWSGLNGQIGALMLRGLEQQQASIADVVAFHQLLLEQIQSGDAKLAQRAVLDHYVREEERDAVRGALIQQLVESIAPSYHLDLHPQI